jgi:outer membrane protein TolC
MLKYILFGLVLFYSVGTQAQESMASEISFDYLQRLVDTAKKYYPRIHSFDRKVAIAQNNIQKAKLSWFDIVSFGYFYSPNNSTTLTNPNLLLNGYQLGIYLNIGTIFQKPFNVRNAREDLKIAQFDKEEYNLSIEAEVRSRYFAYIEQMTIVKARSQSIIDGDIMLGNLKHKFEKGEETYENYVKALNVFTESKQKLIEAQGGAFIAKAKLEELTVKKLEQIQ